MTAIFTGLGAGFERGSGASLGAAGILGGGAQGRAGEGVSVNAANGNLLLTNQDEFLVGLGPDVGISRTYNSQGALDDNGDNWRQSTDRRVINHVTGTSGSVTRVSADGSEIVYAYKSANLYETTDGAGAYDRLELDTGTSVWTWTDGNSRVTEKYAADGSGGWRITEQQDSDGNKVSFTYTSNQLTKIETDDGAYLKYTWASGNITSIETYDATNTKTLTRTHYAYDSSDRLIKVTTDLTPEDNAATTTGSGATLAGVHLQSYVTTYAYDSADRVISITQTDGSKMEFTYDGLGKVTSFKQTVASGELRTTSITYGLSDSNGNYTQLTGPTGDITKLHTDTNGQLTRVTAPPAVTGAAAQVTVYDYNSEGNVIKITDPDGGETFYTYDQFGNAIQVVDPNGSVTQRVYDVNNNLVRETTGGAAASGIVNHIQGGDLSQGASIFSASTGFNNPTNYSQTIQTVDGRDAYVIDTDGHYASGGGYLLASQNRINGGDLDSGAHYTVIGGEVVSVSFDAKRLIGLASSYAEVQINFLDANGTTLGYDRFQVKNATDWTRGESTTIAPEDSVIAPADTVKAFLTLSVFGRAGPDTSTTNHTKYALRDFQLTRGVQPTTSQIFDSGLPSTVNFFYDSVDHGGGGGSSAISTVDGADAIVLTDTAFETFSHNAFSYASQHWFSGGDSVDGKSWSVSEDEYINLSFEVQPLQGANSNAILFVYFYDASGGYLSSHSFADTSLSIGSWGGVSRAEIAPTNAASYKLMVRHYGHLYGTTTPPATSQVAIRKLEVKNLGTAPGFQAPAGSSAGTDPLHSRFVYDAENHLRYSISAEGNVTEYRYHANGTLEYAIGYPGHEYASGSVSPTLAAIDAWQAGLTDKSSAQITKHTYDARGGLTKTQSYNAANASGVEILTEGYSETNYTRDASGQLLTRQTVGLGGGLGGESFVYDGLGRVTSSVSLNGDTSTIVFTDASTTTTITSSVTGYASTSVYDKAGGLLSQTGSGSDVNGGSTYDYNDNGRLWRQTVESGRTDTGTETRSNYYLYDDLGRKTADINHLGDVVEYRYDDNNRIISTTSYATSSSVTITENMKVASVRPTGAAGDLWSWNIYDAGGRVIQTIDGDGAISAFEYDGSDRLIKTTVYVNELTTAQVTGFKTVPPTSLTLPTLDAANDIVIRSFYDKDGRMVGALNGEGYLSRTLYDNSGQVIQTITYAGKSTADLATATLDELVAGITLDAAHDINTRSVYNGQGQLRFSIDGLGQVTEFIYREGGINSSAHSVARSTISYAAALGSLADYEYGTIKTAVAALGSTSDNRTSYSIYNNKNQLRYSIDGVGTTAKFTYDTAGRVTETTQYASLYTGTSLPTEAAMDTWAGSNAANARVTQSVYNERGELRFVIDAEAQISEIRYGEDGQKVSTLQWSGTPALGSAPTLAAVIAASKGTSQETFVHYDGAGRTQDVIDAEGVTTRITYTATGQQATIVSAHGSSGAQTVSYTYDTAGQVLTTTDPESGVVTFEYDAFGNVTKSTDARGNDTVFTYDQNGQVLTTTDPENGVVTFEYDAFGNVVKTTDARGKDSFAYYDNLGRVTLTVNAQNYATKTVYTEFGEVESVTRFDTPVATPTVGTEPTVTVNASKDITTTYTYDKLGRVDTVTDGETDVTDTDYTVFGEVDKVIRTDTSASTSATTEFDYDDLGRLETTTDANGKVETYAYDAFGNRTQMTNKLGGITTYVYDKLGRMTEERLPVSLHAAGNVAVINKYVYDDNGNLTKKIEADGLSEQRNTLYEYDSLNRLTKTRVGGSTLDFVGGSADISLFAADVDIATATGAVTSAKIISENVYDANGNVIQTIGADGAKTWLYYDKLGRVTDRVSATGTHTFTQYDNNGNVEITRVFKAAIDPLPTSAGGSAPTKSTNPVDFRETSFTYDDIGQLLTSTVHDVQTASYASSTFTVSAATQDLVTSYTYDSVGNVVKVTDPNGNETYSYYDQVGNKTHQVDQADYRTDWVYDANGNVTKETRSAQKVTTASTVLLAGTLDTNLANNRVTDFTYDANGNRLTEKRLGVDIHNTASKGAHTTADSTITYTYNALGQVDSKTEATGEKTWYYYDNSGRLYGERKADINIAVPTATQDLKAPVLAYSYDGLDNLTGTKSYGIAASTDATIALNVSGQALREDSVAYDNIGRQASITDAENFTKTFRYDAAGRVVRQEYIRKDHDLTPHLEAVATTYDLEGRVLRTGVITNPDTNNPSTTQWTETGSDIVVTEYNTFGQASRRGLNVADWNALAGRTVEEFAYDNAGRVWKTNSGDGVDKYFLYDANGNQTLSVTSNGDDLSAYTSIEALLDHGDWDHNNTSGVVNLTTQFDDGVNATITTYDARNFATEVREPQRQLTASGTKVELVTGRTYSAFGDVATETDALSGTLEYSYNTMGRRIEVKSPEVTVVNEAGAVVTDTEGDVNKIRPTEHYYYDASGRLVASRDANGNLTTQTLLAGTGYGGGQGQITSVSKYLTSGAVYSTATTTFDSLGNAVTISDVLARITTQEFDKLGQVTKVTHAGGLVDEYTYDELGQRIKFDNKLPGIAYTKYDHQGRVLEFKANGGITTSYTYTWDAALDTGVLADPDALGIFGGWEQDTTYHNGKVLTETKDVFGRTLSTNDLGSHVSNFYYDLGGRLTQKDGPGAADNTYTYLNTGKLASNISIDSHSTFTDTRTATYGYDKTGNLTAETLSLSSLNSATSTTTVTDLQDATATYDALGRLSVWTDTINGDTTASNLKDSSTSYQYDANGNIRLSAATYHTISTDNQRSPTPFTHEQWYKYDTLNRVIIAKGQQSGSTIVRGGGIDITYDKAGQRKMVFSGRTFTDKVYLEQPGDNWEYVNFTNSIREEFIYNDAGQITQVKEASYDVDTYSSFGQNVILLGFGAGVTRSTFTYTNGQKTRQLDYDPSGNTLKIDRTTTYNAQNQVATETTSLIRDDNSHSRTVTTNTYNTGTAYSLGSVDKVTTQSWTNWHGYGSADNTSYIDNTYEWHTGAVLKSVANDVEGDGSPIHTTTMTLGATGELHKAVVADGQPRTITYTNDVNGQVIARDEVLNAGGNAPHDVYYRFGGKTMGKLSNNGTANVDYHASLAERTAATPPTTGPFRNSATNGTSTADFDQFYNPINSYDQGSAGGTYTVRTGDNLQSIAAGLYGDSALWYKIAQANGLSGSVALIEGQSLVLPAGVTRNTNTASTFAPYDPGEAIGDVSPTTPEPPKEGKCGAFGKILLVVISVAVQFALDTFLPGAGTALGSVIRGAAIGAASSAASQAVGVATGIQEKFSWKAVGLAAIAAGVGASKFGAGAAEKVGNLAGNLGQGVGKIATSTFGQGFISGVAGNVATQGIALATGLQDKFDFVGVAAAGIGGGFGNVVGEWAGPKSHEFATDVLGLTAGTVIEERVAGAIANGVTGAASALANAATRTAISGSNFGDNVIAAIPDVIGQALSGYVSACFTGETLVHTPNGTKRIDEIKVGDWVLARDEDFNSPTIHRKQVEELFRYEDRTTLDATITDENRNPVTIRTTPEHPFAITDDGGTVLRWVAAGDLEIGQRTLDKNGKLGTVTKLEPVEGLHTVHNFSVTDDHTYFVSEQAIWVHNTDYDAVNKVVENPVAAAPNKLDEIKAELSSAITIGEDFEAWTEAFLATGPFAQPRPTDAEALAAFYRTAGTRGRSEGLLIGMVGRGAKEAAVGTWELFKGMANNYSSLKYSGTLTDGTIAGLDAIADGTPGFIDRYVWNTRGWKNTIDDVSSWGSSKIAQNELNIGHSLLAAERAGESNFLTPVISAYQEGDFLGEIAFGALTAPLAFTKVGNIGKLNFSDNVDDFIGPTIGHSGYRTTSEFAEAVEVVYQQGVDSAYEAALELKQLGLLEGNANTAIGNFVDRGGSRAIEAFLAKESITEGPNSIIRLNRWLRDPSGSGQYVRPDVYIPGANRVFDATVGFKAFNSRQIVRTSLFSGGALNTSIKPATLPTSGSLTYVPKKITGP